MDIHARAGVRPAIAFFFGVTLLVEGCGGGYGGGGSSYSSGGSASNSYPPTVAFTSPASALTISLGQSVTLSWNSTYATSCTGSSSSMTGGSFSGSQMTSGTAVVAPSATGTVTYMLSCSGMGGNASATSSTVTVNPSLLDSLTKITTIGSTIDPIEKGGNPYGLAIAPVASGSIAAGDLVICNFNDGATNTQGLGTTVVGLHPAAGSAPYRIAQSSQLQGCSSLAAYPDDSISVTAFSANDNPLVTALGNVFASNPTTKPWSQVYASRSSAQYPVLYVSSIAGGTIARVTLINDTQTSYTEIAKGFCAMGAPGAIYGPSGLTYDPSIDTLYVIDTSSYSVVSLSNVSAIGTDGVVVNGSCSAVLHTPTPALTFSGASSASAKVIASVGKFNAPLSATLLKDGTLAVANADIDGPPTTNLLFQISPSLGFVGTPIQLDTGAAGALFGLAASTDANGNQVVYFNDDNDNTVKILSK